MYSYLNQVTVLSSYEIDQLGNSKENVREKIINDFIKVHELLYLFPEYFDIYCLIHLI